MAHTFTRKIRRKEFAQKFGKSLTLYIYMNEVEKFEHFFFCNGCERVLDNITVDGNINRLGRHAKETCRTTIGGKIDKERLRTAAVNFVSKDLRPYLAIECEGLLDLCNACMEFGQKYRRADRNDLEKVLPSRNTVKEDTNDAANYKRKLIALCHSN